MVSGNGSYSENDHGIEHPENEGWEGFMVGDSIEWRDKTGKLVATEPLMNLIDIMTKNLKGVSERTRRLLMPDINSLAGDIEQFEAQCADRRRRV